MVRLFFLFAALGTGLFVGTQFSGQQGYVLISIAEKTIEMSVTTLVVFIIMALAGLFLLENLLKRVVYASSTTWNWFSVRKNRHSIRYTNQGIIKLIEGDWQGAEKKLTRWASYHDTPLVCYLAASEAAQGQGNTEKRDHYLELASQQENSHLAVEITRAKHHLRENDAERAFETLQSLKNQYPDNPLILSMLSTAYIQTKQWQALLDILPKLMKAKVITSEEQQSRFIEAQIGLLQSVTLQQGIEGLIDHWRKLPRKIKQSEELFIHFIQLLIGAREHDHAFSLLKSALKKQPSERLYQLLAKLDISNPTEGIQLLESAVKADKGNAEALSALGRSYAKQEQWPEAQKQLEAALHIRSSLADYTLLADILEKQDMTQASRDVSKKALALVS